MKLLFFSLWTTIFRKCKSVFFQILHQSLVPSNITPLYFFFSSNTIYFAQKNPIKVQIFEIFKCSGQNLSNSSCHFWIDKSIPLQVLYHSSLSWHIIPLLILSSYIFNFRQKDAIKVPFWRLSSALVPNSSCQFLETQASFPSIFVSILSAIKHNSSVPFLAETLYTLVKVSPLNCKFLRFMSAQVKIC